MMTKIVVFVVIVVHCVVNHEGEDIWCQTQLNLEEVKQTLIYLPKTIRQNKVDYHSIMTSFDVFHQSGN
jgi:hypothetical protein